MKIVVLDGYALNPGDLSWGEVERLADEFVVHDRTPVEAIAERAAGAQVVVTNKAPLSGATIGALADLRLVAVTATGHNVVDSVAARERGVAVANVPEYGTDTVAQFVFALILELCCRAGEHSRAVIEDREWEGNPDWCMPLGPLVELSGRTLAVVGFGRIGRRVGAIARAFGMHVVAVGGGRTPLAADYPFVELPLVEAFARADVVSLHCPQTPQTAGMVNAALLARMKPTAFLVNTARGGLVVEADLAAALNDGRIAGAAVDVVSREPIESGNPLLHARNIVVTPHIAWATHEARRRLMAETAENIRAWKAGATRNVVN